jgi:ribosomal protein S15P/S13E
VLGRSLPGQPTGASLGIQQKITLSEQQIAILRRALQDVTTKMERNNQDYERRSSEILTVEQQNKIRDYLIKLRAW